MKKTRKSSMMVRLVAILTVTMMFTMCFVGGTFAKYTSSGTGSDTATVAKWSFKVGAADIAATDTFIFDLFNNTVKDSNGTANETDMSPVDGSIIAPGTQGSFALVLENKSQVNATYAIDYTVTNTSNIPVQFSVDGTTWKDTLDDVSATSIAHTNGSTTITVQWRWVYETYKAVDTDTVPTPVEGVAYYTLSAGNYVLADNLDSFAGGTTYYTLEDAFDTSLGSAATLPTLTVSAKVTATQVD